MRRLIDKCAASAVAMGTLRRSAHIGRLGEYAELAARHGYASMIVANTHGSGQRVAPIGGKRPRLGTNPLCIGMPGGEQGPFIFGKKACYVDLSLFQMIEGLRYAFPRTMRELNAQLTRLTVLHDRVSARPRIAAYLGSSRRLPFNEQGIFRHYPELEED